MIGGGGRGGTLGTKGEKSTFSPSEKVIEKLKKKSNQILLHSGKGGTTRGEVGPTQIPFYGMCPVAHKKPSRPKNHSLKIPVISGSPLRGGGQEVKQRLELRIIVLGVRIRIGLFDSWGSECMASPSNTVSKEST